MYLSFRYFLISSQVHQEKNALSEAAWILSLSSYTKIENFMAKLLPVGGLGLLQLENPIILPGEIHETISKLLEREKIFFCFKIIPLEFFGVVSEETIFSWLDSQLERFEHCTTWKVDINKRHSSIDKRSLITKLAKKITNPVDLKNPSVILQIEIIGKFTGMGILLPYQIIQLSSQLSEPGDQFFKDQEEDFEVGV